MAKNAPPFRVAPLQKVVAEPIIDPAEQSALDELRRREQAAAEPPLTPATANGPEPGVATRALQLAQQLSARERALLLAELATGLPPERQLELLARVLSHLSPEVLPALEEELAARLGRSE
jgi:DNA-directed RNA polymerase specialized sigma24 family protein